MKKKVLVAMSGGVDSSVSAYLLKEEGFDVAGVTMCFGTSDEKSKRPKCCGKEAIDDAKEVCLNLKIPHYVFDFSKELQRNVIEKFVSEYFNGRTPNPCVDCNRNLKFGLLLEKTLSLDFDFLATGHYAKTEKRRSAYLLKRAKDKTKDQSYFLYAVRKDALKSILFPLGGLTKNEVRTLARKARLPVAEKSQSQDICFIPGGRKHEFLSERISIIPHGEIITLEGRLLGYHKGAAFYTIGQRSGLGVGYQHPLYVVAKDMTKNVLVVGKKEDLKAKGLVAGEINILVNRLPQKASAQIRYNQKESNCSLSLEKDKIKVIFDRPEEAIAPGQSVVFYDGELVLGGGVIEEVIP